MDHLTIRHKFPIIVIEIIFDYEYIQQLREEHRRGQRDNAYELFAVLIFDTWYRKYITGTLPKKVLGDGRQEMVKS